MKIRRYITMMLFLLMYITATPQNNLSVGKLTGGQGKDVLIPISLENTDEVVALQFDLQLPFDRSSRTAPTLSQSRINEHTVSVRNLGNHKYRVVVVNMSNRPLSGNAGTIINFPMAVPTGLDPGTEYAVSLSDVIITNRKGDNIQGDSNVNGSYTVQRENAPDLATTDVNITESTLVPGKSLAVTWKVSNIGNADTRSGWTERVYLVSNETEEAVHIGNTYFSNTLIQGGYIARSATFNLSQTVGLEGEVTAKVVVEPSSGCGEYNADRANNTATGGTAELEKHLFLTAPDKSVKEGESMRLTLKRSGDRSMDETFSIASSLPEHAKVPATVTISKGQSAASFDVVCPDNNAVNDYSKVTITVNKANGYPQDVATSFNIKDDELLPLTVKLDKTEYNEGETMKATVSVPYCIGNDTLTVYFSVEKPKRFRLPKSYTFEPGATEAVIDIPIIDDNIAANDETLQLSVSADHHLTGTALFVLKDNDVPAISMTLLPTTVSEAAGYNAIHATIKRTEAKNSKITLKLSDDSNGELYYTTPITMPEGTEEVTFPIGVKDNQKVDGTRKVKFSAAIYITDCGCSAIGDKQTVVSDTITILDNDGPTLSVTSNKTTILEGDATGATLTISRNDATTNPLTVTLSAKGDDLQFAKTVTIPAGKESVATPFVALSNEASEGNRTISVIASSDGYSPGTVWMLISDQTLPDAEMQTPACDAEIEAGSKAKVTVKVKNIGAIKMPKGTQIRTSIGTSSTMTQTDADIAVGATYTSVVELDAPSVPGNYRVTAEINPNGTITELQTINNSAYTETTVTTAYTYGIGADKNTYNIGDKVVLSGTVKTRGGATAANVEVEPYIIYAGSRIALKATTDAEGKYSAEYAIQAGMGGEYGYGVCTPGENISAHQGTFAVYGISRTTTEYIKHEMYEGDVARGTIKVKNMSSLPQHSLTATCEPNDQYEVTFGGDTELAGGGTAEISYTIKPLSLSKTKEWDRLTFNITTAEGASLSVVTYNYTRKHTPNLVVSTNSINTTVTKGKVRTYPIVLTNTGIAETGKITVSLPAALSDFISLATPATMPSLATGDSATVMLKFNAANYDVNVYQKGSIAINCSEGNGKQIGFNVKVVSEEKGNLRIRVRDENTIYGNKDGEHPYVSNASVRLTDYNTGALVMQDVTGADGSITFNDLNEGYYHLHVTADRHDTYDQNVLVSPGETTEHLATISYQAIRVDWTVEETEIEDEYDITTKLTYETQVPVPVVEMNAPDAIILADINRGKSALFNVVLRNRGLISAQNVQYTPPTADGFVFMPMVEYSGFTLAPEQSYVIPVLVMHEEDFNSDDFARNVKRKVMQRAEGRAKKCFGDMGTKFEWPCGDNAKYAWIGSIIRFVQDNAECSDPPPAGGGHAVIYPQTQPGLGGGPYGDFGDYATASGGRTDAKALLKLFCTAIECVPLPDLPTCVAPAITNALEGSALQFAGDCAMDYLSGKVADKIPLFSCLKGIASNYGPDMVECLGKWGKEMADKFSKAPMRKAAAAEDKPIPALMESSGYKQFLFYSYFDTYMEYNRQLTKAPEAISMKDFGVELMSAIHKADLELQKMRVDGTLWTFDLNTIPDNTTVDDKSQGVGPYLTSLMPNKSANIADFSLRNYVERLRNTWSKEDGRGYISANHMDEAVVADILQTRQNCVTKLVNLGIPTWTDLMGSARKDMLQYMETQSENTCAQVKLEIKQKLVLTRQAFRGTLTIENGSSNAIEDILVDVNATNMETGFMATSREMQIAIEKIEGFEGEKDGAWRLGAGKKGVATILFIPTKYAAPENLTTYSFGGTLSFKDGSTTQNRSLFPVSLQVKPSPELDLTYFMQRDVYGDNPLTPDVVEPVIPAEFSVLIHNKGKGDANNVRMITKKPEIVENEKGLLIDFDIISSSLNGGEKTMALDDDIATQFGTIAAGTASYATWDLTASLMGHFTEYDVSVTHVTDYGNPDLSLLDHVTIHELIHSLNATIGDKVYRAWITNDESDAEDAPDHIYFANGTDEELVTLSEQTRMERIDNTHYRVTVPTDVPRNWFYTAVANPAGKYAKILSITDETNNRQLDPANFWTTDYTMKDGIDPQLDYRLHIADIVSGKGTNKYIVEFEPIPELRLDVKSITSVPADDQIAEKPIEELTVEFNKDIKPETFTREDIVVRHEGKLYNGDIAIAPKDEATKRVFKLNTSGLSENGYYVLQVKTDNITDAENYPGAEGKMVRWMLFKDGLVHYNVHVLPLADWGSVECVKDAPAETPAASAKRAMKKAEANSGQLAYGGGMTFKATPSKGYRFVYWKDNATDEVLSNNAEYHVEARNTLDISAVFEAETYKVTVKCDADGGTMDVASGLYEYGTKLTLDAKPNEGYRLDGYKLNGVQTETAAPYKLTVEGPIEVEVLFHDLSPVDVILDERKDYQRPVEYVSAASLQNGTNVKLYRSFLKEAWNTICLPCAVENPEEVFGAGTQVAKLAGMTPTSLTFEYVEKMEANTPYIIKPTAVNNAAYANVASPTVLYDLGMRTLEDLPEGKDRPTYETESGVSFIGAYRVENLPANEGYYYISGNKFYYIDVPVPTTRYRGFFHSDVHNGAMLSLAFGGGTTNIENVYFLPAGAGDIYDLTGKKVRSSGESLDGLKPGVYITQNKKFVVK
ncbi:MAG: CARDB domain-containing protein [Prevotella sp.]|nr:CARDB domain-containing protein [Prevotella sp.]